MLQQSHQGQDVSIIHGVVMVMMMVMLLWWCIGVGDVVVVLATTTTTFMMNEIFQNLQNRPEGIFVVRGTSLTKQDKSGLLFGGRRGGQ